jgi:pimeloyl-ACP methyl ester carboxylesterase
MRPWQLGSVALALSCVAGSTAPAPSPQAPRAARPSGMLEARIDAGGLALHIHCEGQGTPTVVFDSGLGLDGSGWFGSESEVGLTTAQVTRACAYDRAGRGQSDPPRSLPHSNRQMARELFSLLHNAGEHGPYVLVGHSMGGTNVQLFLADHPDSVAGLLLLDASPAPPLIEDIPPAERADFERNIRAMEGLDIPTLLQGFVDLEASGRNLGDKPLLILVAGRPPEGLPPGLEEHARADLVRRQATQQQLTQLSTNSLLRVVDTGHHIPHDDPALVARAIAAVVAAARSGSRLDPRLLEFRDSGLAQVGARAPGASLPGARHPPR